MKASVVFRMTAVAAGVSWPFFQEDRLDSRFENLEIKNIRGRRSRLRRRGARRTAANPGSKHFPFRVGPRLPEYAACVYRIAARLLCQKVEQERAAYRIVGSHQLGDELKVLP